MHGFLLSFLSFPLAKLVQHFKRAPLIPFRAVFHVFLDLLSSFFLSDVLEPLVYFGLEWELLLHQAP